MTEIRHYLRIDAPPEKVYEAVTTRDGLAAWRTEQTVADSASSTTTGCG